MRGNRIPLHRAVNLMVDVNNDHLTEVLEGPLHVVRGHPVDNLLSLSGDPCEDPFKGFYLKNQTFMGEQLTLIKHVTLKRNVCGVASFS